MVVLGLMTKKVKFLRYITDSVEFITNIFSPESWKYIQASKNPADLAYRPLTSTQ